MATILILFLYSLLSFVFGQIPSEQLNALIDIYESTNGDYWLWDNCLRIQNQWDITTWKEDHYFDCSMPWCFINILYPDVNNTTHCVIYRLTFNTITFPLAGANLSGTIPSSIGDISSLISLDLRYNLLLHGKIPLTIFQLTNMSAMYIENNGLLVLPHVSSFCNYQLLQFLGLANIQINGPFEDFQCIFQLPDFVYFNIDNITGLNGKLNNFICNATQHFSISNIYDMIDESHIPECIYQTNIGLNEGKLFLYGIPGLTGTIPSSICNLTGLTDLYLQNNALIGTIPPCLFTINTLNKIQLQNNSLTGNVPKLQLPNIEILYLNDNKLHGSVSKMFDSNNSFGYESLIQLRISSNNFHDVDISKLLDYWINISPNMELLDIADNPKISGSLPNMDTANSNLWAFVARNIDLYGSIPETFNFTQLRSLLLYGNRLSCNMPSIISSSINFTSIIVMPQNLLSCKNNKKLPLWVKDESPFVSATNLYLTNWDFVSKESILIVVIFLFVVLIVFHIKYKIYQYYFKRQKGSDIEAIDLNQPITNHIILHATMLTHVEILQKHFMNSILYIIVIVLLIIYGVSANYFECCPILYRFSACFYYSNTINTSNENDIIKDWILCIVCLLFNFTVCYIQYKISLIYNTVYLDSNTDNIIKQSHQNKIVSRVLNILKCIIYITGFVLATFITILYLIVSSLPHNNTLHLNQLDTFFITNSISIVLIINTTFIIPNMVATFNISQHINRNRIILLLRMFSVFFFPLLFAALILPDCGSGWTQFWLPCISEKNSFKLSYVSKTGIEMETISTFADFCQYRSLTDIDWNKCLRTFLYHWTYVIIIKLFMMMLMPLFILIGKNLYRYIVNKLKKSKCFCIKYKYCEMCISWIPILTKIQIESQYIMIIENLELVMVFGFVCPLILPLSIIAIEVNKYLYNLMVHKFKYEMTASLSSYSTFPVNMIMIGIFMQQLLSIMFFYSCINYNYITLSSFTILGFVVIDTYFFLLYQFKKRDIMYQHGCNALQDSTFSEFANITNKTDNESVTSLLSDILHDKDNYASFVDATCDNEYASFQSN